VIPPGIARNRHVLIHLFGLHIVVMIVMILIQQQAPRCGQLVSISSTHFVSDLTTGDIKAQ
jgi:hypothetical protein